MILQKLLQLIYPSLCASCSVVILPEDVFCASCVMLIKPVASRYFALTQQQSLNVIAAGTYQGPLRMLVLKKLHSDRYASYQLAQCMLKTIEHSNFEADLIIPVPLHWMRYARRGFNQAEVIAKHLANALNIPMVSVLKRTKKTQYQSRLSQELRSKNVAEAFEFKAAGWLQKSVSLEGKKILLIDDLCTSGATLISSAKVLIQKKPASIKAIVACRAL